MSKKLIWLGVFIGSTLGGYLPALFGADVFSFWSIVGSVVGGIVGVFAGNKLGEVLGV